MCKRVFFKKMKVNTHKRRFCYAPPSIYILIVVVLVYKKYTLQIPGCVISRMVSPTFSSFFFLPYRT